MWYCTSVKMILLSDISFALLQKVLFQGQIKQKLQNKKQTERKLFIAIWLKGYYTDIGEYRPSFGYLRIYGRWQARVFQYPN